MGPLLLLAVWAAAADRVVVEQGALQGYREGDSYVFKAIPYARPPLGPLRWRPPQPAAAWQGTRDATQWPPYCLQTSKYKDEQAPVVGSEDCLYLNVFRPLGGQAPLPVMVWIHGGGGNWGASSLCHERDGQTSCVYDGRRLAESGPVIVVTLNYRLGPLGYLAHPALSAQSGYGGSGNYGHMDQIAALDWVRRNIGAFGGDPGRVTLFGESHGGKSVQVLMASPLARGLFQRAIVMSGNSDVHALAETEARGREAAAALGCGAAADAAACLRALPARALIEGHRAGLVGWGYRTGIDRRVLVEPVEAAFAAGRQNDVAFMIGNTEHEATTLFDIPAGQPATWPELTTMLRSRFRDEELARKTTGLYRQFYPTPRDAYVAVLTDRGGLCLTRSFLFLGPAGRQPRYRYQYSHTFSVGPASRQGAGHGAELPFLFGTFMPLPAFTPNDEERALSRRIQRYWTTFAAAGAPTRPGELAWPRHDFKDLAMDLEVGPERLRDGVHTQGCDLWETGDVPEGFLQVTPARAEVEAGGTVAFSAVTRNAAGQAFDPQPRAAWSVSGGGTIGADGVFTAAAPGGLFSVEARAFAARAEAAVTVLPAGVRLTLVVAGRAVSLLARRGQPSGPALRLSLPGGPLSLPLVEPYAPDASPLRVRTSAGTKAVRGEAAR